jgi:hypothetical protein
MAAVFAFAWAGMGTLANLSENHTAEVILRRALVEPTRAALTEALRTQPQSPVAVDDDLLNFSVDRNQASDINLPVELAGRRAAELYANGLPKDPGIERTRAELPRNVLALMTADRHQKLSTAKTAALIGVATAFLLCAAIATGAARFLLPGAAALLAYLLLQYHVRLFNLWVERNSPGALTYRGKVRIAAFGPSRDLLFVAITLLVAGVVFRGLRGPLRAAFGRSRQAEPEQAAGGAPA